MTFNLLCVEILPSSAQAPLDKQRNAPDITKVWTPAQTKLTRQLQKLLVSSAPIGADNIFKQLLVTK
ncbi:hypothetical protein INT46_010304 [Mucor plumbeus]|uniref:Uncharacterized protein n=1 Tax=Mucor plumbeus TaxID=97098 RepID=A0A8H7VD42_9FUNG|nr:hypothetical protein INT46_010304 [Mucor plumbeus]